MQPKHNGFRLLVVLVLTVLVSACQSVKESGTRPETAKSSLSYKESELPTIKTSLHQAGKGVPNGRSDSAAPFLKDVIRIATETSYGYSEKNPIKTGPFSPSKRNLHLLYLNALRGPNGESVEYERKGACCQHRIEGANSSDPLLNMSILDVYRIRVDGSDTDKFLFVDMYESGAPQIPQEFTQRKQ